MHLGRIRAYFTPCIIHAIIIIHIVLLPLWYVTGTGTPRTELTMPMTTTESHSSHMVTSLTTVNIKNPHEYYMKTTESIERADSIDITVI